ncbi:DUF1450 domain-containing protein [Sulfurovum mangrovi]|uniref:DUF1450 domain-containing protein n=1 Tax=Sulfurovum mangrovi TaxID=2893889 RepID=UPI001E31536A|nr:DUF1450 domain-containing protein [Sulfurovum mangrovi]UFH59767.1 YuzB family protein [Sulfurovum mangrovi]UFH60569.1 YuzB family protein [Sulfurovum mangrovi]
MKIKLCKKFSKIKKFEKKLSKAFPDSTIIVNSCIGGFCNKCRSQPVAKVDGVKVKAKRMGKLIKKIEALYPFA